METGFIQERGGMWKYERKFFGGTGAGYQLPLYFCVLSFFFFTPASSTQTLSINTTPETLTTYTITTITITLYAAISYSSVTLPS